MIWSYTKFFEIFESIDDSLKKGRVIPALMLTYSSMSSFSLLTESEDLPRKDTFENWVKKWMLEKYPLPCTASEIYVSMCRLLHQPETESSQSKKEPIREILYSWDDKRSNAGDVDLSSHDKNTIFVKAEDIVNAYRNGMIDCIEELENDEKLAKNFRKKSMKLFSSINYSA
ncbi:hypothetical protein GVN16_24615 [Emticicia sp. CRIBPO]|uniref:hypothetical protein n=1 Tax=Emticicia sp. CRIBPO TaxID=2683258 RepID=UPI0014124A40|nr:hypothetical protein [Emticicia sp. CRIBPO]NBA88982.1 hypothetical protein [Emticicia sp. CRIBPO]